MENESKKKKKKQVNKKKENFENRSPLQDLNGVLIYRKNCRKNCTSCSSTSSVSVGAPRCCLRPLISSTSSSSKTLLKKKSKPQSNFTEPSAQISAAGAARSSVLVRSKENDRKKPIFQMPRKNHPPLLYQRKDDKKSSLSSRNRNPVNTLKKGFRECEKKLKNLQKTGPGESTVEPFGGSNNRNRFKTVENFTPAGKVACGTGLVVANLDDNKNVREDSTSRTKVSDSSTAAKTPPIEASVSPEIQYGSHTNVMVSTAAVTPICYGTGHLLSGVTDKRKCRPRGILTVGHENANLFEYGSNDGITIEPRKSLIPMPAEASLQWLLSPCDEDHEGNGRDLEKRLEDCRMIPGNDFLLLELGSSPSTLTGNTYDFVCNSHSYGVNGNVGDTASTGKTGNVSLSPRWVPEMLKFPGPFSGEINDYFLANSPHCTPTHKFVNSREDINYISNQVGDSAVASIGSLSSGNVIQTPDSNSSSDRHIDNDEHHRDDFELDSNLVLEIMRGVSLSPRSRMSTCEIPCLDMHSTDLASQTHPGDLNQLPQKDLGQPSSVFDSMSENMSLSQIRISWSDGLGSRTFEMNEFDCCRCLSDEEIDAQGCSDGHLVAYPENDTNANKENDMLACESNIYKKGKALISPHKCNSCAESICTNGGGLVASGDSDWASCYKNHLF